MRGKDDEKDSEQEDTVCPHFLKQRSGESSEAVRACEVAKRRETASLAKSFAKEPRY
jgi:hypothetical protein